MKNTFARLFVLAVMSYTMTHSYGQDGTNRIKAAGSSFKDALIVVQPTEDPYRLGSPMLVSITITNVSQEDIRAVYTSPEEDDYRVSIFSADGTPMRSPVTAGGDKSKSNGIKSRYHLTIKPGQSESRKVDLARLAHIEEEGTYYLTIARRITTWDAGFIVSDKVKIEVVGDKAK